VPAPDRPAPAGAKHLTVALLPQAAAPGWQVDVLVGAHRRHFDSLPALMAWLAQLDHGMPPLPSPSPPPPPPGIR
jgi:hypothetical protein